MTDRTSVRGTIGGGARGGLPNLLLLASVRRPELRQRGNLSIAALVLRLAGVGLLAWIG